MSFTELVQRTHVSTEEKNGSISATLRHYVFSKPLHPVTPDSHPTLHIFLCMADIYYVTTPFPTQITLGFKLRSFFRERCAEINFSLAYNINVMSV